MRQTLYFSLSIIILVFGIAIGYAISPTYSAMSSEKQSKSMDLGRADNKVDLRYIDGMIAHHLNAIYLAKQGEQSHRKEIRDLSASIIVADEQGIKDLYAQKNKMYNDSRVISEYEKINLGELNDTFDLRFLNALIAHHEDAIRVAKELRTKSKHTETLDVANTVIMNLSTGIQTLTTWRRDWYGI